MRQIWPLSPRFPTGKLQTASDNQAALRILEHDALVQHSAGAAAQKHFETRDSTLVSLNLNNEICKFRRPIEN